MNLELPSKRGVRFLLAEDIRSEGSGKFSLLGVFPGDRFSLIDPPPAIAVPGMAVVMPSLAFVFVVTEGKGKTTGTFRVVGPDRKTVGAEMPTRAIDLQEGRPSVIGATAKPFAAPTFGTYTAELSIGTATFRFPFTIDKATKAKSKQTG
jgi:hypothetical protein